MLLSDTKKKIFTIKNRKRKNKKKRARNISKHKKNIFIDSTKKKIFFYFLYNRKCQEFLG